MAQDPLGHSQEDGQVREESRLRVAQGNFLSCLRRSGIGRKKLRGKQEELNIETEHKLFINLQYKTYASSNSSKLF